MLSKEREIRRIAIFRALQLGDLLVAVPALRALRERFACAEITLIGLPWAASFVRRFSRYIDRFVEFPGFPGIDEVEVNPKRTARFLAQQRAYSYDLVIQMHGDGTASNPFALQLGGDVTVGYFQGKRPARLTLGRKYPQHLSEIERNLALVRLLGCRDVDPRLEFPLYNQDYAEASALLQRLPLATRPWIGIHAGARPPSRRWPAEYFARLADTFAQRFNAQVILTGGPAEEPIVQKVVDLMATSPLNIAGQTSLGGLAALISELDLFISNDTGPAHIANALDVSSVTIFGPADYRRWAPLDQERHRVIRRPVACSPCGYWDCPIDHRCLRWIHPDEVAEAAISLLSPVIAEHSTIVKGV
ncbi:MAG TPA: glycosyltransferase family 9 protein [Ktedonobacteraceae bacterium]|jgi:ADP-heptose:LPS heptosyltransferase|nr:glycosyltransferase family 9 protein [Ktedonobacteraceae bacterium]